MQRNNIQKYKNRLRHNQYFELVINVLERNLSKLLKGLHKIDKSHNIRNSYAEKR